MKKKILSALLAAAMVITSCLPVFAEGEVQPQPIPETPAIVNEEAEEFCECGLAKGHEGDCQKAAEELCECGLAKGHEGECQKAAEEFCECGLAKDHEGDCQKAAEEFCECGLAKGHEGDCQKAAEELCECGLAKDHEGDCQKAAEEFCECGLAKGHEGECQKAAEELCECGLTKGHEGECQKAAEEFCECGLAKDHEGDCQKAAEELCECGLAKDHEGDCQKAAEAPVVPVETPVEYCELRSNDELCSVNLTVSGMLPTDVELIAYDMPMAYGVRSTVENPFGDRLCAAMDISLWQGEEEWQPAEGEMVTVCMDAADLGLENGDGFFVYHVHEEDDGSVTEEMLGPFTVENDKAVFEMSRFSYVLVLNAQLKIEGVKSFYPVSSYAESNTLPGAGNGQWYILGVYFDTSNIAHLLIGSNGKMPDLNKIDSITVNDLIYYNPESKNSKSHPSDGKKAAFVQYNGAIAELRLGDDANPPVVMNIEGTENADTLGGVLDIKLDASIQLTEQFSLGMKATTGGASTDNSFNIGGLQVELHLEYQIQKTIYAVNGDVTSDSEKETKIVSAGNEVIFEIVVSNLTTSNTSIMDAEITDEMPECFDASTVCWSNNLDDWFDEDAWFDEASTNVELQPGGTVTHYVKAKIKSDWKVTEDTPYTNTAVLSGGNIGIPAEDTATIIIEAPKVGSLTITKEVEGNVYDDGDTFLFTVTGPDISMEIVLGAGQSVTIPNLPLGDYTVTENTSWSWRYEVTDEISLNVTLKANPQGEENTAKFTNTLSKTNWLSGTGYRKNLWVSGTIISSVDINKTEGGSNQ